MGQEEFLRVALLEIRIGVALQLLCFLLVLLLFYRLITGCVYAGYLTFSSEHIVVALIFFLLGVFIAHVILSAPDAIHDLLNPMRFMLSAPAQPTLPPSGSIA